MSAWTSPTIASAAGVERTPFRKVAGLAATPPTPTAAESCVRFVPT